MNRRSFILDKLHRNTQKFETIELDVVVGGLDDVHLHDLVCVPVQYAQRIERQSNTFSPYLISFSILIDHLNFEWYATE